jgi:uncharacterized protein YecE (DUF72 family)
VIFVGTCGYSYRDWVGPFYPLRIAGRDMLRYYARWFSAVEVDASFYGLPRPSTIVAMARATPDGFRFSFKAPRSVTHVQKLPVAVHADAYALRTLIEPLQACGKLACILAQFPYGFQRSARNQEYLHKIVAAFGAIPIAFEFRNRTWQHDETLSLLRRLGAALCNVDLPPLDGLPVPSRDVTSGVGYVRFHGRNASQWWNGTNVTRYRYDYGSKELVPWIERISEIDAAATSTYVFFNNHAHGNAARNALSLARLLGGGLYEASTQAELPGLRGLESE